MNGTEIISFLSNNAPAIVSGTAPIVGAIITSIFLRSNTATTEFEKIKAGKFDEMIEELLKNGQMTYTEYYKANNFLKIAKKADKYNSENIHFNNQEKYDFDWFLRYYDAVGNISDEDMQDIWSRILAGEIKRPTSFSLKIIDVLKNMRKSDAVLFSKVCKCSFTRPNGKIFLPNYDEYLKENDINYSEIMHLSEMGLIFCDPSLSLNYEQIPVQPDVLFYNNDLIMNIAAKDDKKYRLCIKQFPFTSVGQELSTLVPDNASDENFILFGKILTNNSKFKVTIHKVIQNDGIKVMYDDEDLIDS